MNFHWWMVLLILSIANVNAGCLAIDSRQDTWISENLHLWQDVARDDLASSEASLPWIIFFDLSCSWNINADLSRMALPDSVSLDAGLLELGGMPLSVDAYAHGGEVRLPDGGRIPPQLILFASTYGEERRPYMVMAMPEIWRATAHHAEDDANELDALIRSVFVHEMTHTAQAAALGTRIDAIVARENLPDDSVDDDMVQRDFGDEPDFAESIDRERELFFEAFASREDREGRVLANEALDLMRARHARWFVDELSYYAVLEDTFLYFEGSANWAAYRALRVQGETRDDALRILRRGGKSWTQDEGLGIFLVIDRFLPDWQETAMSERPGRLQELLERALAAP